VPLARFQVALPLRDPYEKPHTPSVNLGTASAHTAWVQMGENDDDEHSSRKMKTSLPRPSLGFPRLR